MSSIGETFDTSADDSIGAEAAAAAVVRPRAAWGPLALVAIVGLVVSTNIANGVWARWIDSDPEQVIALSSRQRYLALAVASGIGVWPYIVIGTIRLSLAFGLCHLAGRAYHHDLLKVFTRYLGLTPEALDAYHRGLDRAEVAVVPFFVGSNIVAALTGIRRTSATRLAALLAIGIAARLALIWWLAKVFDDQLVDFLTWVQRYQLWIILVSVALVVLVNVRNFRRGSAS